MYSKSILLFVFLVLTAYIEAIAIGKPTDDQPVTSAAIDTNEGFAVQRGYEGYVVSPQKKSNNAISINIPAKLTLAKNALVMMSTQLIPYVLKTLTGTKILLIAAVFGLVASTAVCSYTQYCSSFLPGLKSWKKQIIEKSRPFVNEETIEYLLKATEQAFAEYGNGDENSQDQVYLRGRKEKSN